MTRQEYQCGQFLAHPVGSVWEIIKDLGGPQEDFRMRCVVGAFDNDLGRERTFHREYMERALYKVAAPLSAVGA